MTTQLGHRGTQVYSGPMAAGTCPELFVCQSWQDHKQRSIKISDSADPFNYPMVDRGLIERD
ncbi:ATPase involved in DNA repair [Giardia duodenalis]|uniref:ATPase involved in DNA repair n=1 Tax=Giardia intestinalis TaxID=5741 RepID=V6TQ40_GIAIN|nr:ATPase involved in DNA repair [Giardia intestinalis]